MNQMFVSFFQLFYEFDSSSLKYGYFSKDHRYDKLFINLRDSHGGSGRHKYCGCVYDKCFEDAMNGLPEGIDLSSFPDSKAGAVRHKDPVDAYRSGYEHGKDANK